MKKQDFLNAVRLDINIRSHDSLKKLVLAFARLIPRNNFEEALSALSKSEVVIMKNISIDLPAAVKQLCESISNGDYDLSWDYDEGYYGGYYSDDEVLTDRGGLGEELRGLLETAIAYVNKKRYPEAFSAFDELFSLSIPMKDYDDIDISTMFSQCLINLDISEVLPYYAYSAIMSLSSGERAHKLYEIVRISNYKLNIQDIFQAGADDIPGCKEFADEWIAFLRARDLYHREHILLDAVVFSGGVKALHDFTIEHGTRYQTAYIRLTEMYMEKKDYSQAVFIIMDGFAKLNGINSTRTKIADLLINIGTSAKDQDLIDKAIWEGFISSADLRHFINICVSKDESLKDKAVDYLGSLQKRPADRNYIRFLHGDYESVYADCASDKSFLGWSTSEKGRMIPLFIALLAGEDAITSCMKILIESNFPYSFIKDTFFQELTGSYKSLPDTDWKKYFDWCLKEVDGRVEAIVGGQHRGSYYKASALIVSLAEVIRSSGDKARAEKFIISYKEKYPRHTSFRACLKQDIGIAKFGKLF